MPSEFGPVNNMPYGINDLDPIVATTGNRRVRCFVRGCRQSLRIPARGQTGEVCPEHGIRCHASSSATVTYTYADAQRNIIAAPRLFKERIVGHPYKYESNRFGYEKSEDAVTWNVFRSIQEAGCLALIGEFLTGQASQIEPQLYLWGIDLTDDSFEPWTLLQNARERFESNLPVKRPKTEPDIALHVPGRYLVLIEAKFTSPNTTYERGPRRDKQSLTLAELLEIYDDESLIIINRRDAHAANRVHYQLWRNTVFAEWMAQLDHPRTKAFHVNLVREGYEQESGKEFQRLIAAGYEDRFHQVTWESLYRATQGEGRLTLMHRYLKTKTAGLARAFQLG